MSTLPTGWVQCKLGDLGRWSSGGTPSRSKPEYYGGDVPWVKTGDLRENVITEVPEGLTDEGICNSAAKVFPSGTLLVAMYGATIGRTALLGVPAATNQACAALVAEGATSDVIPYVWKYLISITDHLKSVGQGGAQPNISQEILKAQPIPLAPLAEQRRIVAKLDSLTARSARARSELDHMPRLVEKYKQALLAKAFSGELTKGWRQRSNRPNWKRTTVERLASIVFDGPFGSNLKSVDYVKAGVRVVRLENIGHMEFFGDKETFISQEKFDGLRRHTLQKSDVLFSSFVADAIRVCLFPGGEHSPAINKADCFCIRVDDSVCDPKFLMLSLASHSTFKALEDEVHGATRPRISLGQLRGLEVAICDLAEQQEVIRVVEANFAWLDKVVVEHARASYLVPKLDQSILAKAFRGELVPQDPNDEPASVLLERIGVAAAGGAPRRTRSPKRTSGR